jgi:hypothetical protein
VHSFIRAMYGNVAEIRWSWELAVILFKRQISQDPFGIAALLFPEF